MTPSIARGETVARVARIATAAIVIPIVRGSRAVAAMVKERRMKIVRSDMRNAVRKMEIVSIVAIRTKAVDAPRSVTEQRHLRLKKNYALYKEGDRKSVV